MTLERSDSRHGWTDWILLELPRKNGRAHRHYHLSAGSSESNDSKSRAEAAIDVDQRRSLTDRHVLPSLITLVKEFDRGRS